VVILTDRVEQHGPDPRIAEDDLDQHRAGQDVAEGQSQCGNGGEPPLFDEKARGSLAVGRFADLAVLSQDYLTVPTEEIGGIVSLLTMVGGRVVYADGPFAAYDEKLR